MLIEYLDKLKKALADKNKEEAERIFKQLSKLGMDRETAMSIVKEKKL